MAYDYTILSKLTVMEQLSVENMQTSKQ